MVLVGAQAKKNFLFFISFFIFFTPSIFADLNTISDGK